MRYKIDSFIAECDRYNISDRAAAALATGLLRDFGYVTDIDRSMVIDRFSIRRRRLKRRAEAKLKREEQGMGQIKCLGFDGKRDKGTKVIRDIVMNGKIATRYNTINEEHITFVQDPPGKYLDHIEMDLGQGTGKCIGEAISELIKTYDSQNSVEAKACDGTKTNT